MWFSGFGATAEGRRPQASRAGLHVFTAYRNCVRRHRNDDRKDDTPAALLGQLPRRLRVREVLVRRQDWGARRIHPTDRTGTRGAA